MLPEPASLALFVAAALALLVTPGPAVLYIVARSLDQGRMSGMVSVLGIALGSLPHIVGAALGLSTLLMQSALAFSFVKMAGAAYLIYLGVQRLRGARTPVEIEVRVEPLRRIFLDGFVVNLLNPKTAMFFLAFLPQFVDPARGSVAGQIAALGLLFTVLGITSDGIYAILAGSFSDWLRGNERFWKVQGYATGGIYLTLGVAALVSGNRSK
jgi:threonine/homoserine/homoserine lactone efflux protein